MLYSEFTTRLAATMVADQADADFVTMLPQVIDHAEKRILRDLDPWQFRKGAPVTVVGSSGYASTPADLWMPHVLSTYDGGVVKPLERRQIHYLWMYWNNALGKGAPKYWAWDADAGRLLIVPPQDNQPLFLHYTYRPAPLSASNPETWISKQYPDLLFNAAMIFAAGYQRNYGSGDDPNQEPFWTKEYNAALKEAQRQQAYMKAGSAFEISSTAPVASNGPV